MCADDVERGDRDVVRRDGDMDADEEGVGIVRSSNTTDLIDTLIEGLTLTLFCAVILLAMFAVVPAPESCWIPPNASTRGVYEKCWGYWELWG